mgnify:FL=1
MRKYDPETVYLFSRWGQLASSQMPATSWPGHRPGVCLASGLDSADYTPKTKEYESRRHVALRMLGNRAERELAQSWCLHEGTPVKFVKFACGPGKCFCRTYMGYGTFKIWHAFAEKSAFTYAFAIEDRLAGAIDDVSDEVDISEAEWFADVKARRSTGGTTATGP